MPENPLESEITGLELLAQAVVQKRAMVFVGAGVSMPAPAKPSLPAWPELIRKLAKKAKDNFLSRDTAGAAYLDRMIEEGDFLAAADLIQDLLDNELAGELWNTFAYPTIPSQIHYAIARIPFGTAVTTNFDRLLETAYSSQRTVLTWQDPEATLAAVMRQWPVVIKTHGAIGNAPSIVLAGREYWGQMYTNPRFRQILKWLFMTRTCIFVGSSLRDPDLIHLFNEAIAESKYSAGNSFGMHYAILPRWEASEPRIHHLATSLRIRVIPLGEWPEKDETDLQSSERLDRYNKELQRQLTKLSGEVARKRLSEAPPALPTSDDHDFSLRTALPKLLEAAVEVTGSFRGDICLARFAPGSRITAQLEWKIPFGPTDARIPNEPFASGSSMPVDEHSVCGIAYYTADLKRGVYVKDTTDPWIVDGRGIKHYGPIDYKTEHTEVRSEFAVPIEADGCRIGVLNLESRLVSAYSDGHREAATHYAGKAGRMFATATQRNNAGKLLRALEPDEKEDQAHKDRRVDKKKVVFEGIEERLRRLTLLTQKDEADPRCHSNEANPEEHLSNKCDQLRPGFLLFGADYKGGTLQANPINPLDEKRHDEIFDKAYTEWEKCSPTSRPNVPPQKEPYSKELPAIQIKFEANNRLAAKVFQERSAILYKDAEAALDAALKTVPQLKYQEIAGPVLGFPIHICGQVAGVFVNWIKSQPKRVDPKPRRVELGWRQLDVFHRAAHLVANFSTLQEPLHPTGAVSGTAKFKEPFEAGCKVLDQVIRSAEENRSRVAMGKTAEADVELKSQDEMGEFSEYWQRHCL